MSDPEKLAYRVKELIAVTGLSRSTLWGLIQRGEIPSFKFRGVRMVLRSDLDTWLAKISGRGCAGPGDAGQ